MSVDYKLLFGISTSYLFHDPEYLSGVRHWLIAKYPYAEFAQIPDRAIPDTVTFWYCDHIKNLDREALMEKLGEYQWSDMMFLMISSNYDPFELVWNWRGKLEGD